MGEGRRAKAEGRTAWGVGRRPLPLIPDLVTRGGDERHLTLTLPLPLPLSLPLSLTWLHAAETSDRFASRIAHAHASTCNGQGQGQGSGYGHGHGYG